MIQTIDYAAIAPALILAVTAAAVLLLDAFLPAPTPGRETRLSGRTLLGLVTLAGVLAALAAVAAQALTGGVRRTFCVPPGLASGEPPCSYVVDSFALVLAGLVLAAAVVVVLLSMGELADGRIPAGEWYFLTLCTLVGAVALPAARDLVMLVVALELVSLPVFALTALKRYDGRSSEAAVKLFLVSVVSTAVMLFGVSLLYGLTGTVYLDRLAIPADAPPVATVGVVLVLAGFAFKVAAVPFHAWAGDVYQGAPIPVAALLSVISKAVGFAGLILLLALALSEQAHVWAPLVAAISALTMTAGNLLALRQRHAVRLLAWSSVAQSGYILAPLGVAAATGPAATGASVAYLVFYAAMNLGAFAVVMHVTRHPAPTALPAEPAGALAQDSRPSTQGPGALGQEPGVLAQASSAPGQARGPSQSGAEAGAQEPGDLDAYRGLARRNPAAALALAFCLICLAGLPPGLAGLFAKIVVFREIVDGGGVVLAIVMAVNTVIGLYYYVAWTARLFTPPAPAAIPTASTPAALRAQPVVPAAVPMSIAPVPSTGDAVQVPSTGDAGPTPGTGNAAQVRPGSGDAGPVSGTGNAGPVPGTRDIAPAPLATEAPPAPGAPEAAPVPAATGATTAAREWATPVGVAIVIAVGVAIAFSLAPQAVFDLLPPAFPG